MTALLIALVYGGVVLVAWAMLRAEKAGWFE
jgi:hypothetical protein